MKQHYALLTVLLFIHTINLSAQIIELSDELLSKYDNKKQEEILTKPIDFDLIFPPVDVSLDKIRLLGYTKPFGYYYAPYNIPNYVGYHIYISNDTSDKNAPTYKSNCEVISFSSNNDSVTLLGYLPKGTYEITGIMMTTEECEELRSLVKEKLNTMLDSTIYNQLKYSPRRNTLSDDSLCLLRNYETLAFRCERKWNLVDSIQGINRTLHNGGKLKNTHHSLLVLKGIDGRSYYLRASSFALSKAFLVEQYEYIKERLLHNEWVLGEVGKPTTYTTSKGLDYHFPDTVGVSIKEIAVKDGKFIAIMKIGPDSILDQNELTEWKTDSINFGYIASNNERAYSEHIKFVKYYVYATKDSHLLMRKLDYARIAKAKNDLYANGIAYEKILQKRRQQEALEFKNKRSLEKEALINKYGEKFGSLIFEHKVSIGMTIEMCIKAWGHPRNKTIKKTQNGTQEVWIYGLSQYLIFDNGVLIESATNY